MRAALRQVALTIPGVTIVHGVPNYDGKLGTALRRIDSQGIEDNLIFDPTTGRYIGFRSVATTAIKEFGGSFPAGTVLEAGAVTVAVAGKPDLPAGTEPSK